MCEHGSALAWSAARGATASAVRHLESFAEWRQLLIPARLPAPNSAVCSSPSGHSSLQNPLIPSSCT